MLEFYSFGITCVAVIILFFYFMERASNQSDENTEEKTEEIALAVTTPIVREREHSVRHSQLHAEQDEKTAEIINPYDLIDDTLKDQFSLKDQYEFINDFIVNNPNRTLRLMMIAYFHKKIPIKEFSDILGVSEQYAIRRLTLVYVMVKDKLKQRVEGEERAKVESKAFERVNKECQKMISITKLNVKSSVKIKMLKKLAAGYKNAPDANVLLSRAKLYISKIKRNSEDLPDLLGNPCPDPRPKKPPFLSFRLPIPINPA